MRPFNLKVPSGEEKFFFFGKGRNYVRLESGATVNVTIKDDDSNQEYTLTPGDDVLFEPFDNLRVSHDGAADTSFILYVGRNTKAGSASVSGNIQIVGGSENTSTPPKIDSVQNIVSPVGIVLPDISNVGYIYHGASTSLVTHVTPSANVSGVKVTQAYAFTYSGAGYHSRVMGKTSAPASILDGGAVTLALALGSPNNTANGIGLNTPVILPAGMGLYSMSSDTTLCTIALNFEVL